ncbi:MAG: IS1380 family transposase [Desulfobacteria bacterium]
MTECTAQFDLFSIGRRTVTASLKDAPVTSDVGAVLLGRIDHKLRITERLAAALFDRRDPSRVRHATVDLLRQRVYQIACGYEDAADANTLRHDAGMQLALGRVPDGEATLASQPTLSRFEQRRHADLLAFSVALCDLWIEQLRARARKRKRRLKIILDFDSTDFVTYGEQQQALFHGHYGNYIYYPLLAFDQHGWPVAAILRPGRTRSSGVISALLRIYRRLVEAGLRFDMIVRADAGFSSPELYAVCESLGVKYVIGLITHEALTGRLEPTMAQARDIAAKEGRAKIITSFMMRWGRRTPHDRRIIGKAEITPIGENPRFLITNLDDPAEQVYALYTGRGMCENRIKELKNAMFGDRMSCHGFAANQFRLLVHTTAYILMYLLRAHLADTALASAQMDTIRVRLLKIAAVVRVTARRVWLELSNAHPSAVFWPKLAPLLR